MTQGKSNWLDRMLDRIGHWLASRLRRPCSGYDPYTPSDFETLCHVLRPGDVLLVEGGDRISTAIKYLTQSTWSHAAMYVGSHLPDPGDGTPRHHLVEVNLGEGCVSVPLSKYASYNTRICRPVGLTEEECAQVTGFMISRIGLKYDLRNILDLLRYFFPTPPVPVRWRRRMLAFGSGDPTRAICSSLIAQAFQSVRYPILPNVTRLKQRKGSRHARAEILHIRHHALFAPRDFDLSPYFQIVKPNLADSFDFHRLRWAETPDEQSRPRPVAAARTGPHGAAWQRRAEIPDGRNDLPAPSRRYP
ncbi:permuted papain-like amidase YaeF/Yiix C92 family enzyme [Albidovulum inexpectatum]|uniref:Permuted papain-like amidase YaeF/Yiix C92 family enzyme n=1 Tax=Albidovulum inexpectatum TaxID=196587 RepID=A0A2S5JHY6_9RHOB|nr:lipo-like protein [Albidovulum inexpectatum]PPB80981.1 permuted papain-like amidase YaeF/Yiix C92 family enzyme [Albidovulum inexpectatum]